MDEPTRESTRPNLPGDQPTGRFRALRRLPLTNLQIILIALIIVGGRLVIDFSQRIIEGQEILAEQRQLEAELAALEREQRDLEAAKAYFSSPAFVEAWAHDQGKMVREGEVLVVPLYDDVPEEQAVVAVPEEPDPLPPWQVWWLLFFDSSAPSEPLADLP